MGRSDGTLVRNMPGIDKLIPYIMNRRYDATNFCKVEFDMTNLHAFLRKLRAEGHKIGIMDAVIMAFALAMQKVPEVNRFVAGKKVYQRNHFCVSFVILKRGEGGQLDETAVKVYIEPEDTLLTVSQKMREIIQENQKIESKNDMDRLINRLVSVPLLPGFLIGLFKWMDRRGILPKAFIRLSPFHTSMFLSNLASIQMDHVYHHLYDFGTTSLFVTMGKPSRVSGPEDKEKRVMTLGMSLDDRICTGAVWAKALFELKRNMEHPELLLGPEGKGIK